MVELDQPLRLHPLTYLEEGDEVTVGRADINSFGLFPVDGAALLRRLEAGSTPSEAARWYSGEYGEQVDISEFLEVLEELDLFLGEGEEPTATTVRWQGLGKALFSAWAWALYAALAGAAVAAMIRYPYLVPTYGHLFFTRSSLLILMLGIVIGQLPLQLLHEAFHALAGRRLGLNSTLRIGHRFIYVVFETSLDGLVAVPRRQRYLPMLAGMLTDVVAIAGLTLAAAAVHPASPADTGAAAFGYRFLLSMAFGVVLRFAWQFFFFLRTDLYYLTSTVLGCNDLQTTARQLMWNRIWRFLGRPARLADESAWTPRDSAAARWYSWLMLAGYGLLLLMVATVLVPTGTRLTVQAVHELAIASSPLRVADVLLFLALNFWQPVTAAALATWAFTRRRRPRPAARTRGEAEAKVEVVAETKLATEAETPA
jgi:hypothetical protein